MITLDFLKSRTVWVIIVLFIINGITGVREFFPEVLLPLVDGALSILAIYFRVNTKQRFDK